MLRIISIALVLFALTNCASATNLSNGMEAGKEALMKRDCQTAQQHILPLAEAGDAEAQFQMGWIAGCFNYKDYAEQLKWFLLAADKGHAGARWRASHFYTGGWSVPKDPAKALELTQKAAAQGYAAAEFDLALAYSSGKTGKFQIEQDKEKALYWIAQAANHNKAYTSTQAELMARLGGIASAKTTFDLFLKAAEQGDKAAMCKIAELYSAGKGTDRNEEEAFRWFKKRIATAEGVSERDLYKEMCLGQATFEVARRTYEGDGTPKLEKEGFLQLVGLAGYRDPQAEKWLRERALTQDIDTALSLAATWKLRTMYVNLYGGAVPNQFCDEAKLKQSRDEPDRTFLVGVCFEYGLTGKTDLAKAKAFYERAATQPLNFPLAQKKLGDFYREGIAVRRDASEALTWYLRAASQDYYLAQYAVGQMLLSGEGVKKQPKEAIALLTGSARPFEKGTDKLPRPEKGYARAQYLLGKAYEMGDDISPNTTEAKSWYAKSAAQGFVEAKKAIEH